MHAERVVDSNTESIQPAARRDAVHDVAGGFQSIAVALQWPAERGGGDAHSGTDAGGSGGVDRVLRQHVGATHGGEWRAELCGATTAREGSGVGGVRASGSAV